MATFSEEYYHSNIKSKWVKERSSFVNISEHWNFSEECGYENPHTLSNFAQDFEDTLKIVSRSYDIDAGDIS